MSDRWGIALGLESFAELASRVGQWARAARLMGASEALRERIGAPLKGDERGSLERELDRACAALGEPAFTALRLEGRALPLEAAIAQALATS
jgi:hypothetical protein